MIYVSSGRRLEFPASPFAGGRSFPQFTFICRGTAHTPPNWYLPNYICLIKTQFSTQFEYICHGWNFDETKMKSFVQERFASSKTAKLNWTTFKSKLSNWERNDGGAQCTWSWCIWFIQLPMNWIIWIAPVPTTQYTSQCTWTNQNWCWKKSCWLLFCSQCFVPLVSFSISSLIVGSKRNSWFPLDHSKKISKSLRTFFASPSPSCF